MSTSSPADKIGIVKPVDMTRFYAALTARKRFCSGSNLFGTSLGSPSQADAALVFLAAIVTRFAQFGERYSARWSERCISTERATQPGVRLAGSITSARNYRFPLSFGPYGRRQGVTMREAAGGILSALHPNRPQGDCIGVRFSTIGQCLLHRSRHSGAGDLAPTNSRCRFLHRTASKPLRNSQRPETG